MRGSQKKGKPSFLVILGQKGQNGQDGENYQKSAWNIFVALTSHK